MIHDLRLGDCRELLPGLADNSVDMVCSDPPYFLDGLDNEWDKGSEIKTSKDQVIRNLSAGMNFDRRQGYELEKFICEIGKQLFRILKPGAIAVLFSQPRLAHRMATGIEDAGFEIRDMPVWHFKNKAQFKAFSLDHFIKKLDTSLEHKAALMGELYDKRTIQLKPQIETMVLAQKPKAGTHLENWQNWRAGLMDVGGRNAMPANLFHYEKEEKDEFNDHPTVKPVELLRELIRLFSKEGDVVLDMFMGSGSTAVACEFEDRQCIGYEISEKYMAIARKRLELVDKTANLLFAEE